MRGLTFVWIALAIVACAEDESASQQQTESPGFALIDERTCTMTRPQDSRCELLATWLAQDRSRNPPRRTYRGFTPAKPELATEMLRCDLADAGICPASTELLEQIVATSGRSRDGWSSKIETLLRDFVAHYEPFTPAAVLCADAGCVLELVAPYRATGAREVQTEAMLADLQRQVWFQSEFEARVDGWGHQGVPALLEVVFVLERRTPRLGSTP